MIDIENKIFNDIATAVQAQFAGAVVYSEAIDVPSGFPCVSMEEISNIVYKKSSDSSALENHARIGYEFNIYTNLESGKKTQAKQIRDIIDNTMSNYNFTRLMSQPMPNIDRTIFRIVVRYEGIVSKGVENGNDIVYTIYRK